MLAPTEHQTVHARILHQVQEISWSFVARSDAEERRGFINELTGIQVRCPSILSYSDYSFDKNEGGFKSANFN